MANINTIRNETVIAAETNIIREQTARQVLSASIEIGKLLLEAKAMVPFGEWTGWLTDNFNYSQSTANNLMRVYKEYGDNQNDLFSGNSKSQTFANLSLSQAVALFSLEPAEREDFVADNNVEDMSVRDIQKAIKELKEAEEAAEKARQEAETEKDLRSAVESELEDIKQKEAESKRAAAAAQKKLVEETAKLMKELEEAKAVGASSGQTVIIEGISKDEAEKMKHEAEEIIRKKYEKELDLLREQIKESEEDDEPEEEMPDPEQLKAEIQKEVERVYSEKIKALEAEKQALEKKMTTAGEAAVQKFSAHFEMFQNEFNILKDCSKSMASDNPEMSAKLRAALSKIIEQMAASIQG